MLKKIMFKQTMFKQSLSRILLGTAVLSLCFAPALCAETPIDAKSAFEMLKQLAGSWQGEQGELDYELIAGGSVVKETLHTGPDNEMVSMYHMDGSELVMTHYCSGGNQPRMKLDVANSKPSALTFVFTGGSNLEAQSPHIHGGTISFHDANTIEPKWNVYKDTAQIGTVGTRMTRKQG